MALTYELKPELFHLEQIIEAWRVDYNTVRPHRSLGQETPAAYAAAACADLAAGWGLLGGCSELEGAT